jgi:hypothetical protein
MRFKRVIIYPSFKMSSILEIDIRVWLFMILELRLNQSILLLKWRLRSYKDSFLKSELNFCFLTIRRARTLFLDWKKEFQYWMAFIEGNLFWKNKNNKIIKVNKIKFMSSINNSCKYKGAKIKNIFSQINKMAILQTN